MELVAEQLGVVGSTSISARYRALIRIAQAIRGHRNPRELFELLTRELRGVLPFDGIVQFDESKKVHWNHCADLPSQPTPAHLDPEDTIAWWVYHNQQPLVIHDTHRESRFPAMTAMFPRFRREVPGLRTCFSSRLRWSVP